MEEPPGNTRKRDLGDVNFVSCMQRTNMLAQAEDFQEDVYKVECFLDLCISVKFTVFCEIILEIALSLYTN